MPFSRLIIAFVAVLLAALPAYYAISEANSPVHSAAKSHQLKNPDCPVERQIAGDRCACVGETNWSNKACVPQPPIVRRRVGAVVLGSERHSNNCVFFVRDRVRTLPYGLGTWKGKLAIINAHVPQSGDVAMIQIVSGVYKDVGHVAVIETVTDNSITILEGNYYAGRVSRRTATGADVEDAAKLLGIAGYFRP